MISTEAQQELRKTAIRLKESGKIYKEIAEILEIQRAITDKCPDQLKSPFTLWTRVAVQQLIKELYSVKMPIRTVGGYLHRWGFTPQKPLRKAYKQTPDQTQGPINEESHITFTQTSKAAGSR